MATYAQYKRDQIKKEIEQRGLRCLPSGKAWHVVGAGVDILVADLAYIDASQLRPADGRLER